MTIKGINSANLERWFEGNVDGVKLPLDFDLITGGHSNLTFKVSDAAGRRYVLRRPPTGAVIATAHDMAREHRIISALSGTDVPVPRCLGLCEDDSVNDAPFYVMDYVEGLVLVDAQMAGALSEAARGKLGNRVVEVLAALHNVDPDDVGLGDLGRKEAYIARQLKRWRTQWDKTKTRELAAMDEVYHGLESKMPEQHGAAIVHGDYRLGNMLSRENGEIAAVLDWELCTLGDPLADVGYILNNWEEPGETGRDVSCIDYYRAFQYWRLAAIVEGVLARYLKGVMGAKANTDLFKAQVDGLAGAALDLLNRLES